MTLVIDLNEITGSERSLTPEQRRGIIMFLVARHPDDPKLRETLAEKSDLYLAARFVATRSMDKHAGRAHEHSAARQTEKIEERERGDMVHYDGFGDSACYASGGYNLNRISFQPTREEQVRTGVAYLKGVNALNASRKDFVAVPVHDDALSDQEAAEAAYRRSVDRLNASRA